MKRLILLLILPLLLGAGELHVDKTVENVVKFISDAPVEEFEGVTDKIDGYVRWKGENMADSSEFYFEVDLTTLDTGIGLRNRHMQDNYLETDEFRYAVFSGRLDSVQKDQSGSYKAAALGTFKIHGIEKPLRVHVAVSKNEKTSIAEAKFTIVLTDYNIKVPKLMFMKIDENMEIHVKVAFKNVEIAF
jgi:polyisoprenoid-binding protein YceI